MSDPILIQIDDNIREATPEEAQVILEARAAALPEPTEPLGDNK